MNILQVVPSIDLSAGGPSKSVCDLALNQALQGCDVTIFTNASAKPYLIESPHTNFQLVFVEETPFKKGLKSFILYEKLDVLHGHGIWQMPVHQMAKLAIDRKIPYIISPRGMLEPWALNAGKWKKKLAMALYQRKDLYSSACIHATSQMEADNIRKLGFRNPIAIIPNGIDINEFPIQAEKSKNEKHTLLFLSRIHPKKGIEVLVEAWQQLNKALRQHWQVEIAGAGDESYIVSLQKLIVKRGLANEIRIIGPQYGKAKFAAYQRADLFVLPTYSENFGIVVAEAMACGLPVITTVGTPWEELSTYNAGWWIDIGVDPLVESLENALKLSDEERHIVGKNGRKLVEKKYSIEAVAQQMIELYQWILNEKEKPEFVITK